MSHFTSLLAEVDARILAEKPQRMNGEEQSETSDHSRSQDSAPEATKSPKAGPAMLSSERSEAPLQKTASHNSIPKHNRYLAPVMTVQEDFESALHLFEDMLGQVEHWVKDLSPEQLNRVALEKKRFGHKVRMMDADVQAFSSVLRARRLDWNINAVSQTCFIALHSAIDKLFYHVRSLQSHDGRAGLLFRTTVWSSIAMLRAQIDMVADERDRTTKKTKQQVQDSLIDAELEKRVEQALTFKD